mmetsp:Transcript_21888/g.50712  ORF Transcript_21888/g.50712 Transcript_21888/m.50712 type:complete len:215 (+) Transcript_21888:907-1551(+)
MALLSSLDGGDVSFVSHAGGGASRPTAAGGPDTSAHWICSRSMHRSSSVGSRCAQGLQYSKTTSARSRRCSLLKPEDQLKVFAPKPASDWVSARTWRFSTGQRLHMDGETFGGPACGATGGAFVSSAPVEKATFGRCDSGGGLVKGRKSLFGSGAGARQGDSTNSKSLTGPARKSRWLISWPIELSWSLSSGSRLTAFGPAWSKGDFAEVIVSV